ncbi:ABC-type multidrug transport system, permease component [Serinicoccus hydrothermalis]|uniref:ABC-type multidrug transport system, permease component n=1 Tax=Serinicoccus hydrothermalis TaxID=1758689 RepID=A0A1B1NCU4_9MICO|nr:ABC transporter permease [Serinicoccus hydrothermalis]ANS79257.1 ABC-type multidrug transport system, permease component [Serinicoccus hydrothermalis]
MSTALPSAVLGAAAHQARITLVRKYTSAAGVSTVVVSLAVLVLLWFVRDVQLGAAQVGAGGYIFSGFLAFGVIAAAVLGVAGELQAEREDGTLLRAKAVPHGMTGHLVAKLLAAPVDALVPVLPALVGAALLLPDSMPQDVASWVLLVLVFGLGVLTMLPWGAVLGSVFRTMIGLAWAMMSMYALAALSGVFYPVGGWPAPLQWVAQLSPLYWIGVAVRSVLLPEGAAAAEIGGEFRLELALVVLLAWAVAGLFIAPVLLRRMARRQSGSAVQAARERVLAKGY